TQQVVRQAHHLLAGMVALRPFTPLACTNRSYTRLNEDYRPMHVLCRFFLEHSGPTHITGHHHMKPFLVNMPRLFEQFVAAWLQHHLPAPWRLSIQESVHVGKHNELRFDIDLVLYDENGRSYAVLDTKYKKASTLDPADIHQIITYAHAKKAPRAILIYPALPEAPLQVQFGDTTLETVSFSLAEDLQQAGMTFLNNLLTSENSLTQFTSFIVE
ncbi:MAG: hypothetical protein KC421_10290, partial [Anaerolineales bacterium]|nr:hypothetical protein [Anaerolineales bacterium]